MNDHHPLNLEALKHALIVGGGHGIGLGLVQALRSRAPLAKIHVTYRDKSKALGLLEFAEASQNIDLYQMDPTEESSWAQLAVQMLARQERPELIINCVGFLHNESGSPERSLREFNAEFFLNNMKVNTLPSLLMAKHLAPLLKQVPQSVFAALSAKVASLEDNNLGGWHSYRMSKVALNMGLRNMAIEFQRNRIPCTFLAIHPGTTRTVLAEPFLKTIKHEIHEPIDSAHNILNVISSKTISDSGKFYSWDGEPLPW
jgi:NAD(P)-dependent dehydrogenase (short-subunit alcohol dehydrogenase family)